MTKAVAQEAPAHPASRRGEDVRRRLLEAAAELIPELGWEAVSTRMVADAAGVSPGLVHYHFGRLSSLLREAALTAMRDLGTALGEVLADNPAPAVGLSRLLGMLDDFSGDDPVSLLFVEAYLAATRELELKRELHELIAGLNAPVARWLEANNVPDSQVTAQVVTSAIDGLMLHRALDPSLTSAAVQPVLARLIVR